MASLEEEVGGGRPGWHHPGMTPNESQKIFCRWITNLLLRRDNWSPEKGASGDGSLYNNRMISGAGSSKAPENFFYCASPQTFSWCLPWQCKVQGTVTRTKLGQSWPTVYEAKAIFDFSITLCQRWPSQSIEHEAWVVSYRSSVDTNSVSCSVSEILHLCSQYWVFLVLSQCYALCHTRKQSSMMPWPTDLLALSVICMM